jgi:hypothetical protein
VATCAIAPLPVLTFGFICSAIPSVANVAQC